MTLYIPEQTTEITLEWLERQLYFISDAFSSRIGLWEDLRFPASAINPMGAASDPDWDTTVGGFLFDASSTEQLYLQVQIPHAWMLGTVLQPHVHWEKTVDDSPTPGDVYWQLEYRWHRVGEAMTAATTIASSTSAITDDGTNDVHLITAFSDITTEGVGISDMLTMVLSRIGGDAADTYGSDARLLEFDIHFKSDQSGSEQAYAKL